MWIMSTLRVKGGYHIFIGAIKIAEICFHPGIKTRWKCYLRLMRNDVSYETLDFEEMSHALKHIHQLLRNPAPEGATSKHKD